MSKKNLKFLDLQTKWYEKLADQGFKDIEDRKGYLKQYDRRTISFDNRTAISEFFTHLEHYLASSVSLRPLHREILTLYSQGEFITDICKRTKTGKWTVIQVIKRYKKGL